MWIYEYDFSLKVKLDDGAYMPTRAHKYDAGIDLYAVENKSVRAHNSAIFDTGVHVEIPKGYVGLIKSKSGLNVNHDITSDGTIDSGYTGSIKVKLYNNGDKDYIVKRGNKISQLVITPIWLCSLQLVDDLEKTERGNNGFGSTGK